MGRNSPFAQFVDTCSACMSQRIQTPNTDANGCSWAASRQQQVSDSGAATCSQARRS